MRLPFRQQPGFPTCPSCPSDDFAVGAQTLRGAPIVTCMGCGARWYLSAGAWRKPHPSALPATWAQLDTLARMEKQQAAALDQRAAAVPQSVAPLPRRRAAHEGFRRPPAVEEEA